MDAGYQPAACRRLVTGSRSESGDCLDGALQRAQPLQLAAAVLPAGGRGNAELGGDRPMLEQSGFHRGGLPGTAGEVVSCRANDESRWMVADGPGISRKGEAHAKTSDHGDGGEPGTAARTVAYVSCGGHATQGGRPSRVP